MHKYLKELLISDSLIKWKLQSNLFREIFNKYFHYSINDRENIGRN